MSEQHGGGEHVYFAMWDKAANFLRYKGWFLVRRASLVLEELEVCKVSPTAVLNKIESISASSEMQKVSGDAAKIVKQLCAALRNWVAWLSRSENAAMLFDLQLEELTKIGHQVLYCQDPANTHISGRQAITDIVNATMAYDPELGIKEVVQELVVALAAFIDLRHERMKERSRLLEHAHESGFVHILYANHPNFNNEDGEGYDVYDVRLAAVLDGEDWLPAYEQNTDEEDENPTDFGQVIDS